MLLFPCLQVKLGKNGVEEVLDLGPLSDYEKQGLESLMPELKSSIEKGIKFANQSWINMQPLGCLSPFVWEFFEICNLFNSVVSFERIVAACGVSFAVSWRVDFI